MHKTLSLGICLVLLVALLPLAPIVPTERANAAGTGVTVLENNGVEKIDFNDDWQFHITTLFPNCANATNTGTTTNNATNFALYGLYDPDWQTFISSEFDDSGWRSVNVPHDWMVEQEKTLGQTASEGRLPGGLGWYRKTIVVPESMEDKRITLNFDGVSYNSIVYVNGVEVGQYPHGYTGFSYDITDFLTYGETKPNVIAIKIQSMQCAARWLTGSGINRPVSLEVTDQVRFVRSGVVLMTPSLETTFNQDGSATLEVTGTNYSDALPGNVQMKTYVYDANGNAVAQGITSPAARTADGMNQVIKDEIKVDNVHLWSIDDPYRYTVVTELWYSDGTGFSLADTTEYKFGFRWFYADTTDGFVLNGERVKLFGTDEHTDNGAIGMATSYDAYKRRFQILKDMGVNSIRTSHNPVPREFIDVCSELGIVVIEEAFDSFAVAHSSMPYEFSNFFLRDIPANWAGSLTPIPRNTSSSTESWMWSDWVIKAMVLDHINEPSVVMWSITNETGSAGTRPSWYDSRNVSQRPGDRGTFAATTFNMNTEHCRLRNSIRAVDQSRLIMTGTNQIKSSSSTGTSDWNNVCWNLDGMGVNYFSAAQADTWTNTSTRSAGFIVESESGCSQAVRGVYHEPELAYTGMNQTPGSKGTSSYDNYHCSWGFPDEYAVKVNRDRKGVVGQFLWSGFDYIGEDWPFGLWPVGSSSYGAIDTAGFPKDPFYMFQSQWTDEPMAHIVPMNWNDWRAAGGGKSAENVQVWVYTNAVEAELYLNGNSLGIKKFDVKKTPFGVEYLETTETPRHAYTSPAGATNESGTQLSTSQRQGELHLTWTVPYEPGELRVVARDKNGVKVAEDVIRSASRPYTIDMTPDKSIVKADGRSLVYVECDIVDETGNIHPTANNLVKFDVTGGVIVGVDNGDPNSYESYKWGLTASSAYAQRKAFNGKLLVIIQTEAGKTGEITLTARSDNMVSSTVKLLATADGNGTYTSQCVKAALGSPVSVSDTVIKTRFGSMPSLPVDVVVTYDSGLKLIKKASWDAIPPGKFGQLGTFELNGTVEGTTIPAKAIINVGYDNPGNMALSPAAQDEQYESDTIPLATASFTGGEYTPYYPNRMLNGNTVNYWSNRYRAESNNSHRASRKYDYAEVFWPELQTFAEVKLYFKVGSNGSNTTSDALPSAVNVQYWDGFMWKDAQNQRGAITETTTIAFDRVIASRVRVGMQNATPHSTSTGSIGIYRFEVYDEADTRESIEVTIGVSKIVEGYPAAIPVSVDPKYEGALVSMGDATAVIGADGTAVLSIDAAPGPGQYTVSVAYGITDYGEASITVLSAAGLWTPAVDYVRVGGVRMLRVTFPYEIGGTITADKGSGIVVSGNVLFVEGIDSSIAGVITLLGVEYPELFPSQQFRFDLNYPKYEPAVPGPNLLRNRYFDFVPGSADWAWESTYQILSSRTSDWGFTRINQYGRTGTGGANSGCLEYWIPRNINVAGVYDIYQTVEIPDPGLYTLSCWIATDKIGTTGTMQFFVEDVSTGARMTQTISLVQGTWNNYRQYTFTNIPVTSDAVKVGITCTREQISSSSTPDGVYMEIDDFNFNLTSLLRYTVNFDMNATNLNPGISGMSSVPAPVSSVEHGYKIGEPATPTSVNYMFGGWYKDADCIDRWDFEADTVTQTMTLYAKWMPYYLSLANGQMSAISVRRGATARIALDTNCELSGLTYVSAVPMFATVVADDNGVFTVTGVMAGISVIRITDAASGLTLNVAVNVIN